MNRAIRRIPLQHQAAVPLRIVRIVLDHDGRRNPGDDVANLYIVRGQLLGSVERDSYFVVRHQRLDAVEGLGHERRDGSCCTNRSATSASEDRLIIITDNYL